MSDEHVEAKEQYQHSGSILEISIQLANHSAKPQEPHYFESTEKTSNALEEDVIVEEQIVMQIYWTYILVMVESIEDVVWKT